MINADMIVAKCENMMNQHDITRDALRQVNTIWSGMAYMTDKSTADGDTVQCERVAKFNRKALYEQASVSTQPEHTCDKMINKVGVPGSEIRKQALIEQYAKLQDGEQSPFAD